MKEITKFVKDKPKTIGPQFDLFNLKTLPGDDPFLAVESDRNFVIVDDFTGIGDSVKAETVKEASNDTGIEYDENGNQIYYAEEVFEEDDDLYSESFNDRLVEKQAHRTFTVIGETIDNVLRSEGYETSIGYALLCAMRFSRLISFKEGSKVLPFVEKLFVSISNPHFVIKPQIDTTISMDSCLYDAVVHAKSNPNIPVFVYLDAADAPSLYKYLRPIYPYIDNHNGDFYVSTKGRSIIIPKNLYIMYTIRDNQQYCDVSRRILRYTSILDVPYKAVGKGEYMAPVVLSAGELDASFKEAADEFAVRESSWKKIDNIVNLIHSVNGYSMHNKIVSRLESYAIARLSSKEKEDDVLDDLLSSNFILEAIITDKPNVYSTDKDIINLIDGSFGMENMKRTKAYIKSYLDLFDKGGKRKDA